MPFGGTDGGSPRRDDLGSCALACHRVSAEQVQVREATLSSLVRAWLLRRMGATPLHLRSMQSSVGLLACRTSLGISSSADFDLSLLFIGFAGDVVPLALLHFCRVKLVDGVDDELDVAEEMVDGHADLSYGHSAESAGI